MNPRLSTVRLIVVVLLAGSAGPAPGQPGSEGSTPDDNPRIDPEEVASPSVDAGDPSWKPGYALFEDPRTIQCHEKTGCEEYKAAELAKSESSTTTTTPPVGGKA